MIAFSGGDHHNTTTTNHNPLSLLAESLVEEWLNREGYFTIRGAKHGNHEIDLLAVRQGPDGIEARHIECQISTNAMSYVCPLTKEQAERLGKVPRNASRRNAHEMRIAVEGWVEKKFKSAEKEQARTKAWASLNWSLEFVHGDIRHHDEIDMIRACGINVIPVKAVLQSLCNDDAKAHRQGGVGSDITDLIRLMLKP